VLPDRPAQLVVVRERRQLHPLAWIHRSEARSIAAELRVAGHEVLLAELRADERLDASAAPLLLRLSDPVMYRVALALTAAAMPYFGPGAGAMSRCYDKYEAWRIASADGVDCPATMLARDAAPMPFPLILKPRRGSDSIGVRLLRNGPIPAPARTDGYIAQERIFGAELTVGVLRERIGMPLRLHLPAGAVYSFARKYLLRPGRSPVADPALAARVRRLAREIAAVLDVDWAARIDLIHETATDRLRFLECDVAPLVGARSAFAASLAAAGVDRSEQLRLLLT
jgi:D-alanine-D-alanine ligase-like ATP-grasp enzyme